ncbi:MAG: phosphonate ABC transporter, partial [Comamonas sp.]
LGHFARIVGIRDGRVAFDLPTTQVTDVLLQALYANADGSAVALPTLHNLPAAPSIELGAATPIQVIACR